MKDFLPYKSYRLVDTPWMLGSEVAGRRLSGCAGRTSRYELELRASSRRCSAGGVT